MAAADSMSDPEVAGQEERRAQEERFRGLFCRYYRSVLAFFARRGPSPAQDCEDLAQDTFLRVFRGEESFRGEIRFQNWLFRIAANVHSSALEKGAAAKRASPVVSLDDTHTGRQVPCPSGQDPLDHILTEERLQMLQRVLDQLPEQMRRCVTLRFGHDLKYREIADTMKISIQTVKAHLAQARARLRALVEAELEKAVAVSGAEGAATPSGGDPSRHPSSPADGPSEAVPAKQSARFPVSSLFSGLYSGF